MYRQACRRPISILARFAGVKPYRGILIGLNEAFLIDTPTKERLVREDPRSVEIIKPHLRGQDIKRWSPTWAGLWVIFVRWRMDIEKYPAMMLRFREQLERRPKDWAGKEWLSRKPGLCRWYKLQDAMDYWPLFEQPNYLEGFIYLLRILLRC